MPHKQYFHKPTVIKDLIIITVVNLLMFIIYSNYDVLENIYHFSRQHEYFELDEVLILVAQNISGSLPNNSYLYRWLDDNFIVILPTSVSVLPFDIANKIQQTISGKIMPSILSLTRSIGFSIWQ